MVSNSFDAASATAAAARVRSEATKVAWQVEKFIRRVDLRSRQIFSLFFSALNPFIRQVLT